MKKLTIKDRGEVCSRRSIPLVDVYLTDGGECWLSVGSVSVDQAKKIAEWFKAGGVRVKTEVEEASSEPQHQRNLFE